MYLLTSWNSLFIIKMSWNLLSITKMTNPKNIKKCFNKMKSKSLPAGCPLL